MDNPDLVIVMCNFFLKIAFDFLVDPEVKNLCLVTARQHVRPGRADAVSNQKLAVLEQKTHGLGATDGAVVPALSLKGFHFSLKLRHVCGKYFKNDFANLKTLLTVRGRLVLDRYCLLLTSRCRFLLLTLVQRLRLQPLKDPLHRDVFQEPPA